MTTVRNTYYLNKIKKLVDLNGDSTNFDITFKVSSKKGEPFDIVVVDQTTLDNSPELQYRTASNGTMSGNIVQDKNIYQNYFLVLKADQPCEVDVEVTKKEIVSTDVNNDPSFSQSETPENYSHKQDNEGGSNWKMWLIITVIIGGIVLLFFVYKSDKKGKSGTGDIGDTKMGNNMPPSLSPSPNKSGMASPLNRSVASSNYSANYSPAVSSNGNDLLRRLKTLHMG